MTVFELILIIIALCLLIGAIGFIYKRLSLLFAIISLGKEEGVRIEKINYAAFLLPRMTRSPAVKLSASGEVFSVRLFSGKGQRYAAHLASERYAAVFMKSGGEEKVKRTPAGKVMVRDEARVYFPRTVILPAEEIERDENSVIIFSPSPRELTYVTKTRTAIRVAMTGDLVFGSRVFTKTTFINYIDRLSRDKTLYLSEKSVNEPNK